MNYYELAILKSPLTPLTYQSENEIKIGKKVLVKLARMKKLCEAVVLKKVEKPTFKCVDIQELTNEYYDLKMLETAKFISTYYVCSIGEALSSYSAFDEDLEKDFEEKSFDSDIKLSKKQEEAFTFLKEKKQALLFANTGSGKTEVYIKTIEKHLNEQKQAVLLMPEISLTPQMQKRLEKVFHTSVAIWHSKVTKKKKKEIIQALLSGEIRLIAGARSSLFLPFKNLGVIVVDEEHDESYKSDSKPRFQTKDLAIYLSKKYDIQLILGSATPSASSFNKIPYYRLKETFFETKRAIEFDDSDANLSPKTIQKINKTLQENKQVIVFLPTRANFKYQICTSCGKSVECPYCSVSMSLHKNDLALKCHYCGYAQQIPQTCPSCNIGIIHNLRVGTAQIEEELNNLFPNKVIKRFDRDEIKTDTKLKAVLNDFNNNKIDILVGTQMLSKGHDYHNVKLAVVLGIDSVLNMNSYKAREKALSLLIQIAGRSGRKGEGEVIIQTKNQEFFEYFFTQADYKEFLEEELEFREDLYPPYVKMARILFAHINGLKVKDELDKYVNILKQNNSIEVVGFGQCAIFKLANKYRYEVIIRSKSIKAILTALHSINSAMATIDMDTNY
ncbi:primosomal protein N' [Malaciobacter marinus]|jgi:primosomal protein N' (replication factor Y)|uniref:primosomal protein N' n=1 Tax=Malaciobacter marinus TaxID=505249 RepID=UPI0009A741DB|nr:primosomal protein N' [Malaciobacter marinus]SKB28559.1 replication restart DNA helicase PriA [Malaciobacter marinus]